MFSKVTRLLAFVVLVELSRVDAVPVDKFYPFGTEHGDTALAKYARETSTSEISLRVPVKFYGYEYNLLYISGNGLISFLIALPEFISLQFPLSYPVIAALYANVDSRGSGQVFYRETTDAGSLIRVNNEIYQAFPNSASSFRATSLFVVTWYQVSPSIRSEKKNTFQVAIASNGVESFIEFLYADDGIQWIQGEGAPGTGTLGAMAQAGLTAYDGRSHTLQGSGTDQIRHLTRLSNFNEAGVWIFRSGNIERTSNIEEPDKRQIISQQVAISRGEMSCSTAFSLCHSQATCVDTNQKFCCTCRKGFYGNGYNCLKEGVPLRANGKVNLNVNGIHVTNQDVQVYIMPSDGKVYAALSKIPQSIGNLLQVIYPVTGMLNWLFAIPTSNGLNGFQITGGVLEHSADIIFRNTSDRISVVQKFFGVFDHLKMEMQIQGRVPTEALGRPEANDYQMQFNFVAPGLFKSSSSSIIYKTTSPTTSEVVEHQISLEQTIKFNESCALDFNSAQAGVKGQYSYYRVKTARTFITYEGPENILRFSATSKVSLLTENDDPCIEGRIKCVANSSCVVEGDSFRCICNSGFQTTYSRRYNEDINNDFGCLDVNECAEGKANCNENAMCVNEIGSYHCSCKPGYTGDGYTCTEIDNPCGSDFRLCNPPNSYCRVPNDHRTCDCTQGYQKTYTNERRIAFTCFDVDECERNACGPYANCRNLPGSYSCECKPGYVGDGYQCQRAARNECELNPCGPNSICRNSGDSFKCECKPGYLGNGYQCYRANVSCNVESNCSPNGECILNETSQSYVCQCIRGYYGDGYQCQAYGGRPVVQLLCSNSACWCPPNFVATGEWCVERTYYDTLPPNVSLSCFVLPSICHPNAMCIHNATTDQYYCACNSGYDGSGHECAEMETSCLQRSDICDQHATCRVNNRTGKASCVCNPQYQGDGIVCNQIEMCLTDSDCKANEECFYNENAFAYDCRCKRGYAKAADGSCQVIRNCPRCYPTASCVTDVVSGRDFCRCPPGFRGDGVTFCEETPLTCNPTEYNCSSFATCDFNLTSASYECHCKRGFVGDGITCVRATNCFDMPDICDRNARCVSLSQPYGPSYAPPVIQCQCKSGYVGNGTFCYEIPAHEGGFLFVNWGPTILRVPYEPSVTNPGYAIQTEANQIAIGLTIDCQRNRVFWSDYSGRKIKSATFKGKNVFTVVTGNITAPEGLAVDWLNQVIYWTDSGKKVIEAVNLDGTNRRVVIAKNLTNPRGIAVEPYRRKLFWSDWNRAQPKIEWSNLDGSDRATFVSGPDVQLPNSVTIDASSDELCWADAGIKRIMCIGIETRLPRMITAHCVSPFGLTVSSTRYFWTEKSIGKVGYYDKITSRSGNITLPATGTGTVYGIVNVPIEC